MIDMKNRITDLFAKRRKNLLSVFYTAGYPRTSDTVRIGVVLEQAGVDFIEIGIPFSDPIADGPTIQESNKVSLDQGMTVPMLLEQVTELRAQIKLPIILMGYLNPVMQYGVRKFMEDAAKAGVDGLILPDLPLVEYEHEFQQLADSLNISLSFLVAPTTSEARIRKIDALTNGFIYAVSSSSTTGAKEKFSDEQVTYFKKLQDMKLNNPFLIGFGISNPVTFQQACASGSGAIVGSSFVSCLAKSEDIEKDIPLFIHSLKS